MSRFLHTRYAGLETYTPGEQPRDQAVHQTQHQRVPLSPLPGGSGGPGPGGGGGPAALLRPRGGPGFREKLAGLYGVTPGQVFLSNGSDDILNFAFMAFGEKGAVFPSLTYSFYPVFANLHQVPYETVPLREDFSVDVAGLSGKGKLTVLANPNAPTGLALPLDQVEALVASNPAMWWWWMRPMWTSAPRPPQRCWVGMRTFWW